MPLTTIQSGMMDSVAQYYGFKNRIINPAMVIDQRNAGASVTPTGGVYTLDRWALNVSAASKVSVQRNAGSVTPPAGFTNYAGLTSTSAYTVLTGDFISFSQAIEGFNVADFGWGTANAITITLSFWVRSSLTGTFGGVVQNDALNRSYPFSFVISAANTWEQKSITIPGDTSGTWLTNNGAGIRLLFGIGVGSTFQGTAGAWASANLVSVTGATNIVATNGATFYITGVQLEKGSTATSFDYRPYGTELALCQRYFYNLATGNAKPIGMGSYETGTRLGIVIYLPVTMRAFPSIVQTTGTNYYYVYRSGGYDNFNSLTLDNASTSMVYLTNTSEASGTAGQTGYVSTDNASTSISVSAEL